MSKNYRQTDFYKSLDSYTACETVEWSETATAEEQIIAWQWIADTGLWQGLQGWYGRNVASLLGGGYINDPVTKGPNA